MVEVGEFRNHPIIILKRGADDKFPFQFGAGKARLILEHIDEIKKFADANPPKAQAKKGEENG